jgi:hypothetical protein
MITIINHRSSYKPEQSGTAQNDQLEHLALWIAGGGMNERQVTRAMLIADTLRSAGAWTDGQLTLTLTND